MAAFLFQLELPELDDKIMAIIPIHREHINKLFTDGRLLSYSVSIHRNMVWCVVDAEEEQEAMQLVLDFPLYKHFTEVSCNALLFHNTQPAALPDISLN